MADLCACGDATDATLLHTPEVCSPIVPMTCACGNPSDDTYWHTPEACHGTYFIPDPCACGNPGLKGFIHSPDGCLGSHVTDSVFYKDAEYKRATAPEITRTPGPVVTGQAIQADGPVVLRSPHPGRPPGFDLWLAVLNGLTNELILQVTNGQPSHKAKEALMKHARTIP